MNKEQLRKLLEDAWDASFTYFYPDRNNKKNPHPNRDTYITSQLSAMSEGEDEKKEAIGFNMWLQSFAKSGYPKNDNGTCMDISQLYEYWNTKVDKNPYYTHANFDKKDPHSFYKKIK